MRKSRWHITPKANVQAQESRLGSDRSKGDVSYPKRSVVKQLNLKHLWQLRESDFSQKFQRKGLTKLSNAGATAGGIDTEVSRGHSSCGLR